MTRKHLDAKLAEDAQIKSMEHTRHTCVIVCLCSATVFVMSALLIWIAFAPPRTEGMAISGFAYFIVSSITWIIFGVRSYTIRQAIEMIQNKKSFAQEDNDEE